MGPMWICLENDFSFLESGHYWEKEMRKSWKECNIDYSFDKDKMNGTHLIQNLRWLGKSNKLIDLLSGEDNDDASCDDIDDEDGEKRPIVIGRGIAKEHKRRTRVTTC